MKYSHLKINGFDLNSFNGLVDGKSIHYLESASTILYYMGSEENFTRSDVIQKLNLIKSHIDFEIVENAFGDIIRLNFFKNNNVYEIIVIDDNLEDIKEILLNQINDYMDYFTDFGQCNNSIIVSGSLDYLSMVLEKETLDLEMEKTYWNYCQIMSWMLKKYMTGVEVILKYLNI